MYNSWKIFLISNVNFIVTFSYTLITGSFKLRFARIASFYTLRPLSLRAEYCRERANVTGLTDSLILRTSFLCCSGDHVFLPELMIIHSYDRTFTRHLWRFVEEYNSFIVNGDLTIYYCQCRPGSVESHPDIYIFDQSFTVRIALSLTQTMPLRWIGSVLSSGR